MPASLAGWSMAVSQIAGALTVTLINSIVIASAATSLGEMGGYRVGLAVAGMGCLIGAVLVAVFVCPRVDEGEMDSTVRIAVYGGFGLLIHPGLCDGCLACETVASPGSNESRDYESSIG